MLDWLSADWWNGVAGLTGLIGLGSLTTGLTAWVKNRKRMALPCLTARMTADGCLIENVGGETAVLVNIWYRDMEVRSGVFSRSLPAGGSMTLAGSWFNRDAELVVAWRPMSHVDVCVFQQLKTYLDGGNAEVLDLLSARLPFFGNRRWIRLVFATEIFRRDSVRLLQLRRQGRRLRLSDAARRRMVYESLNAKYQIAGLFANTSSPASSDSPDTLWRNGSVADQAIAGA